MASFSPHDRQRELNALRWPLGLTRAGMLAEALWKAFWPLVAVAMACLALLMMGIQDSLPIEMTWAGIVLGVLGGVYGLYYAATRLRLPDREAALDRLDATLPGRPIRALLDDQVIGANDSASTDVWRAHQARMAERASHARPVPADLRTSRADPFALRYVALLALCVALLFGSIWRVGSVAELAPGGETVMTGPVWEGWVEPPRYTGRPTLYLNDIPAGPLDVPEGSLITLRLYGEVGALTVAETVSGRIQPGPASASEQDFTIIQSGELSVNGPGGRSWNVGVIPDNPPQIAITGDPEGGPMGEATLPFSAQDDYGVEAGEAQVVLDLASVDRRHGLAVDPEQRPAIIVPLPMPIAGSRAQFEESLIEDFSEHPFANLPVSITLTALDASEQQGHSEPRAAVLPGRSFFDPLAAAIIEQRRDLLWNRTNAGRVAQILRAVSYQPEEMFRKETDQLRLNRILRRIEIFSRRGMSDEQQEELAKALWELAIVIEEGDLASALERLRRAQERLQQAMRDGATQAEIEELMRELRRATEDYMRQMMQQAQRDQQMQNGEQREFDPERDMMMSQDDIQRMMDRIQELMEQGRMAEAEEAMRQLQQMLENMRMAQGQPQSGQGAGDQAMEGLAETLREQQGLSDQAFRDLQEQFNPGAQAGENQGNQGRDGGQGRGQQHSQSPGQGGQGQGQQQGQGGGEQSQQARPGEGEGGQSTEESLADRQRALRQELNRQQQGLPGAGTPEGDAARDALDRAGRAMDRAEDALRGQDYADAIDNQAQAMEALREGIRALGEALQQQAQGDQQQGQGMTESDRMAEAQDPLGRAQGNGGRVGTDENLLQGEDVYRRARDLLDEIRRRASEGERPDVELDYLGRLLERF